MAEAFEYAVRKDVRNNPIVREVDAERQAEMWKTLALAALVVVAADVLDVAALRAAAARLPARGAAEAAGGGRGHRASPAAARSRTLRSPKRIEGIARGRLNLVTPTREDAIVIERVVPAEPPAKSVVARR